MMKYIVLGFCSLMLVGCATNDYAVYVDAQKSISKDLTVSEAARMTALIEMSKSTDPAVRATAILQLQALQANSKRVVVEPPKKSIFGF